MTMARKRKDLRKPQKLMDFVSWQTHGVLLEVRGHGDGPVDWRKWYMMEALKWSMGRSVTQFASNTQEWQTVAFQFADRWDFPNCVGAIDGKHIRIVPPPHSVVLMVVVLTQLDFLFVEVGKNGRILDGGVFAQTELCQRLQTGGLGLPPDDQNVDGLPSVFTADEAFALGEHLMRPFPQRFLTHEKRVFNYRLARARRVVENAFGILDSRFRLFLGHKSGGI
ncbi:uncharacterized protein [Aquarana catesbeiana]|uniref:uncharacterized protein n=1 Tax=Aquarana catesbeiana TaxID=8400 RepID=UPI003CC99913